MLYDLPSPILTKVLYHCELESLCCLAATSTVLREAVDELRQDETTMKAIRWRYYSRVLGQQVQAAFSATAEARQAGILLAGEQPGPDEFAAAEPEILARLAAAAMSRGFQPAPFQPHNQPPSFLRFEHLFRYRAKPMPLCSTLM